MLLNEARLLEEHSLSVLPREEERAWLPTIRSGEIPCITERIALREIIGNQLNNDRSKETMINHEKSHSIKAFCSAEVVEILTSFSNGMVK